MIKINLLRPKFKGGFTTGQPFIEYDVNWMSYIPDWWRSRYYSKCLAAKYSKPTQCVDCYNFNDCHLKQDGTEISDCDLFIVGN